jgi:hypothetical protein
VARRLSRIVCRMTTHDWWAVAYPPARRWECHRCGRIVEEAPSTRLAPAKRPASLIEPDRSQATGPGAEEADRSRSS